MNDIRTLVDFEEFSEIVLGLPLNMNGSEGPASKAVREFAEATAKIVSLKITFWDERLSSKEASRVLIEGRMRRKKRKQHRDMLAAVIILQSYLDSLV